MQTERSKQRSSGSISKAVKKAAKKAVDATSSSNVNRYHII